MASQRSLLTRFFGDAAVLGGQRHDLFRPVICAECLENLMEIPSSCT